MRRPPGDALRRDAVGLGLGVGVFGVSFGALAVTAGLSLWQAQALSLLMFTGGSQYALVGVLASGGSAAAAATVAWLLGARNAFYAVRLAPLLARGPRRAVEAQWLIDETTAMATAAEPDGRGREAFLLTGASVYVFWNVGTLLGSVAAGFAPDPELLGLDAAFPAAFVALLAPRLRADPAAGVVAVLGGAVALALTPYAPAGVPVLAALVAVAPAVVRARRRGDRVR